MPTLHDFGSPITIIKPIITSRESQIQHPEQSLFAVATQAGWIYICSLSSDDMELRILNTFDLQANGPIWAFETFDINDDGIDELIIGGTFGRIVVLDYNGNELWDFNKITHQCESSISGIKIWKLQNQVFILIFSLDRSLRMFNATGTMLWAEMFSAGVGCADALIIADNPMKSFLIAGGNDGTLRAYNFKTGSLQWFTNLEHNIRIIEICNNQIYLGGDFRILYSVNPVTQELTEITQFETYVWNSLKIRNGFCISTFSFKAIGMDDGLGDPEWKIYSSQGELLQQSQDFPEITINIQAVFFDPNLDLLVFGGTDGQIAKLVLKTNKWVLQETAKIPSTVNSLFSINMPERLFMIAGADDGHLYLI